VSWSDIASWFSAFAAEYGDRASVLGTALTLIGFTFTLWQLIRTRKAAEQARQIASEALARVSSGLLLGQVSSGVRLITELSGACRLEQWDRAIDRCEQLQLLFASIVENAVLGPEEKSYITNAVDDLKSIRRQLEERERGSKSSPLPMKMRDILDELTAFLGRLDARLKRVVLEIRL
jgi:hypothetical protein